MINNVGNVNNTSHIQQVLATNNNTQGAQNTSAGNNNATDPVDTVSISERSLNANRPGVRGAADPAEVQRLWSETNHMTESIRSLIQSLIGRDNATGQGFWAIRAEGLRNISEADRLRAQELVSDEGFFGVEQTTDRIMGFARALVGENASEEQIERMRNAVQRGFDDVARLFGGFNNLPQVTRDTHAAVMAAFDEWRGTSGAESA